MPRYAIRVERSANGWSILRVDLNLLSNDGSTIPRGLIETVATFHGFTDEAKLRAFRYAQRMIDPDQ